MTDRLCESCHGPCPIEFRAPTGEMVRLCQSCIDAITAECEGDEDTGKCPDCGAACDEECDIDCDGYGEGDTDG